MISRVHAKLRMLSIDNSNTTFVACLDILSLTLFNFFIRKIDKNILH